MDRESEIIRLLGERGKGRDAEIACLPLKCNLFRNIILRGHRASVCVRSVRYMVRIRVHESDRTVRRIDLDVVGIEIPDDMPCHMDRSQDLAHIDA
ncbi:MAG: hypothetical protein WC183_09580, partial [Methanosarcina sp.]